MEHALTDHHSAWLRLKSLANHISHPAHTGFYYLALPTVLDCRIHPSKMSGGNILPDVVSVDCTINTGVPAAVNYRSVHHQVQPVNQVSFVHACKCCVSFHICGKCLHPALCMASGVKVCRVVGRCERFLSLVLVSGIGVCCEQAPGHVRVVTDRSSFWNNFHFQVGYEVWGDGIAATLNVQVPSLGVLLQPVSLRLPFDWSRHAPSSGSSAVLQALFDPPLDRVPAWLSSAGSECELCG
jgi:hypothetical protein